jgi:hypothetical protein
VAQLNFSFLSLLFVDRDPRGARLEERDGDGKSDGLAFVIDGLQDGGLVLAVLERPGLGRDIVRRLPRGRCERVICECSITSAKARLMALFEVMLLDSD